MMGWKVLCCMVTLCKFLRQGSTEQPTACSDHKTTLDIFSDTLVKRLLELFSVTTDIEDTEDTEYRASYHDGLKAKCPAGTFYNSTSKRCKACSPGSYRFTVNLFSIFILIDKFQVIGKYIHYILAIYN